ncbi:hypothetical protein P4639_22435 [Priestia megaterium]|uniref:hypothetical protein n=1 Tax=Priestia megaterium TaxID=1404 RepID=UPI002E21BAF0|nr:hypothetical protein [Priestia megaterium]
MLFNNSSKIKLFTHIDLDGIGCEVVGRLAFKNISVERVRNPQHASEKVEAFIRELGHFHYDKIFITDISVNKETADYINGLIEDQREKFVLLDHHATANFLNKYPWANVSVEGKLGKNSGTNMFFECLVGMGFFHGAIYKDAMTCFVEKIRRYDTWEWKEIYNDLEASKLNDLFWLLGADVFTEKFTRKFTTGEFFSIRDGAWVEMFNSGDLTVLSVDKAKKESYIKRKGKQMNEINLLGNKVGVVFAEQYVSELGNELSENNRHLKYIAIIDMGNRKVSLRTVHDDIDLGKDVASHFGGGGHPKASGFQFDDSIANHSISMILNLGIISKVRKMVDKFSK